MTAFVASTTVESYWMVKSYEFKSEASPIDSATVVLPPTVEIELCAGVKNTFLEVCAVADTAATPSQSVATTARERDLVVHSLRKPLTPPPS